MNELRRNNDNKLNKISGQTGFGIPSDVEFEFTTPHFKVVFL